MEIDTVVARSAEVEVPAPQFAGEAVEEERSAVNGHVRAGANGHAEPGMNGHAKAGSNGHAGGLNGKAKPALNGQAKPDREDLTLAGLTPTSLARRLGPRS